MRSSGIYYRSFEYECALLNLCSDRWMSNQVILLGDYADEAEEGSVVFDMVKRIRSQYHYDGSMQDFPDEFQTIDFDRSDSGYRYVYNHAAKQYIDYHRILNSDYTPKIYPLVLLPAVGNRKHFHVFVKHCLCLIAVWCS